MVRYTRTVKRGLPNKGNNPHGDYIDAEAAFQRQIQLDEIKTPDSPLIARRDMGIVVVGSAPTWTEAAARAERLLDIRDDRIVRTGGPMGCIVVETNDRDAGGWLFFGNMAGAR